MDLLFDWLNENKEWLFSGIAVTAVSSIVGTCFRYYFKNFPKSDQVDVSQTQGHSNVLNISNSNIASLVAGHDITSSSIGDSGNHDSSNTLTRLDEGIAFVVRLGGLAQKYWREVPETEFLNVSLIEPLEHNATQFFMIDKDQFVDDVDPAFDITLVNREHTCALIHKVGIEIVSVAHELKFYGTPRATRITPQEFYVLEMPDLRSDIAYKMGEESLRLLEQSSVEKSLSLEMRDPFLMEVDGTFRYEILLKRFIENMPNYSVLRFWAQSDSKCFFSDELCLFTI